MIMRVFVSKGKPRGWGGVAAPGRLLGLARLQFHNLAVGLVGELGK